MLLWLRFLEKYGRPWLPNDDTMPQADENKSGIIDFSKKIKIWRRNDDYIGIVTCGDNIECCADTYKHTSLENAPLYLPLLQFNV